MFTCFTPDISPFHISPSQTPPLKSQHQKQHMITYLFLIQMYMIHILTVSPPTTIQVEPGPGAEAGQERSWWAPSASPASQAAAQVQVPRHRRHRG